MDCSIELPHQWWKYYSSKSNQNLWVAASHLIHIMSSQLQQVYGSWLLSGNITVNDFIYFEYTVAEQTQKTGSQCWCGLSLASSTPMWCIHWGTRPIIKSNMTQAISLSYPNLGMLLYASIPHVRWAHRYTGSSLLIHRMHFIWYNRQTHGLSDASCS